MKGNNELHLNTATMIEAVQQWLDAKMPNGAPTVTSVLWDGTEYMFVVPVSSDAEIEKGMK